MLDAEAVMSEGRDIDDTDSFMDAIDPLMPDAYRLAYGMLRSRDEAGDAVQEAALNAWRHRRSFRRGADMRPWFLAIVANQCRGAMRQRWWSVIRRPEVAPIVPNPGDAPADDVETLRQGMRKLKHSDRLVLVLRYYLDLSFNDVAAMLHISPTAARVRTHRALSRLKPILEATADVSDE